MWVQPVWLLLTSCSTPFGVSWHQLHQGPSSDLAVMHLTVHQLDCMVVSSLSHLTKWPPKGLYANSFVRFPPALVSAALLSMGSVSLLRCLKGSQVLTLFPWAPPKLPFSNEVWPPLPVCRMHWWGTEWAAVLLGHKAKLCPSCFFPGPYLTHVEPDFDPFIPTPGLALGEPVSLERWVGEGPSGKELSKILHWEQISFSRKSWQNEALNYNFSESIVILLQTALHHGIWKLGKYKTH